MGFVRKYNLGLCSTFNPHFVKEKIYPLLTEQFRDYENMEEGVMRGEEMGESGSDTYYFYCDKRKLCVRMWVAPKEDNLFIIFIYVERVLFSGISHKELTKRMQGFLQKCLKMGVVCFDTTLPYTVTGWMDIDRFLKDWEKQNNVYY